MTYLPLIDRQQILVERGGSAARVTKKAPGTLGTFKGHGVGNPRERVSGQFTSLVNCGEQVNPLIH